MYLFNDPSRAAFRKKLRNNSTLPEVIFWKLIKNRQCANIKFRRQCSIGRYIVDFYSFEARLALEIDGEVHYLPFAQNYDFKRTAFLNSLGITVLRFTNDEILKNSEECFELLERFLDKGKLPKNFQGYFPPSYF